MSKYFLNANVTERKVDGETVKSSPKVYITEVDGSERTPIWLNGLPRSAELAYHTFLSESIGQAHVTVDVESLMGADGVESSVSEAGHTVIDLGECDNPVATLKAFTVKVNNAQVDEDLLAELRAE